MNQASVPTIHQMGNTVRLKCKFEAEVNGELQVIDPHSISINIYNGKYELLQTIPVEEITKDSTGNYSYYLTLPMEKMVIVYEWVGGINAEQVKKRGSLQTVFLDY